MVPKGRAACWILSCAASERVQTIVGSLKVEKLWFGPFPDLFRRLGPRATGEVCPGAATGSPLFHGFLAPGSDRSAKRTRTSQTYQKNEIKVCRPPAEA
jgi:hypothetical protein